MNILLPIALVVVAGCLSVNGDITGSNPSHGTCLCISGSAVNVRYSGITFELCVHFFLNIFTNYNLSLTLLYSLLERYLFPK